MVESEDTIILDNVPIVTPSRDVVASGLTFKVGYKSYHIATDLCDEVCLCELCESVSGVVLLVTHLQ